MADEKEKKNEIALISEETIKDRIYTVRGVQVMLDFDLAEIYGYTTKRFNEQVQRNIEKFDTDFMFQLSREETYEFVRSQIATSRKDSLFKGQSGGSRYLPYVFTEQGIYMLMTVLRGDLAVKQSKALIRLFKRMKDYYVYHQDNDYLKLLLQVSDNRQSITDIKLRIERQENKLDGVALSLKEMIKKEELSPFFQEFCEERIPKEYLFLDGEMLKSDIAYMQLYSLAERSVIIVDDYINAKTLHLLQNVKNGVSVTVISDNVYGKLRLSDLQDFMKEFPNITIDFKTAQNKVHDRFIILDFDSEKEKIYHCGASSKDAGKKVAAIAGFSDETVRQAVHDMINEMISNPPLILI